MSKSPSSNQLADKNEENVYEVPPGSVSSPLDKNQAQRASRSSLNDSNEDEDRGNDASSKKSNSSSTLSTLVSPEKRARGYTEYLTPSLPNALDTLSQATQQSSTGTSICGLSDKSGGRNQRRASRASKLSAASHRSSVPKKVPRTRHKVHKTVESTPQLTSFSNKVESRGNLAALSNQSMITSSPRGESKALIFDQLPKTSIPSIQSVHLEQIAAQIEASAAASVSQTAPFIANRKRSSIVSNQSTSKNGAKGSMFSRVCTRQHYPSGLYGWRKRSLYFVILITSCITVINLSLLAYLYTVLDLSLLDGSFGGGSVLVSPDGITVAGTAVFFNSTLASRYIRSTQADEPLTIKSNSDHILLSSLHSTAATNDMLQVDPIDESKSLQRLVISPESVNIMSDRLHIRKSNGELLFSADASKFTVASDHLRILRESCISLFSFYLLKMSTLWRSPCSPQPTESCRAFLCLLFSPLALNPVMRHWNAFLLGKHIQ